mmetsp:Transcript_12839/g.18738  ORF Transcript_12839/g.18738 Transcript_12839/m.18738 type:complete len:313 (-) Transcript_12839:136-1074(-)
MRMIASNAYVVLSMLSTWSAHASIVSNGMTSSSSPPVTRSEVDSILSAMQSMQESNHRAVSDLTSSVRALIDRMDAQERDGVDDSNSDIGVQNDSKMIRRSSMDTYLPPLKQHFNNIKNAAASVNFGPQEEEKEEGVDLERVAIRFDGIEVYAVVSALTLATAVASFEMIGTGDWNKHWSERNGYKLSIIALNLFVGAVGVGAGLHSVIVFSLSLMYGRTAVGLGRDDAFGGFFRKTALQRVRGFRSFLISMYAFMVQMFILIESRCPYMLQGFVLGFMVWLMSHIHRDAQAIIQGAECIFLPPEPKVADDI